MTEQPQITSALDVLARFPSSRELRGLVVKHCPGKTPPEAGAVRMWRSRCSVPARWVHTLLQVAVNENMISSECMLTILDREAELN